MQEILIVFFCLIRAIVMKLLFKKKVFASQQEQQMSASKPSNEKKQEIQSPQKSQLLELRIRKQQVESSMEQYNNPSSFAKYSKLSRQLIKINNQIQALQQNTKKQQSEPKILTRQENSRSSLLQERKKQAKNIHKELANKDMLIRALINLGLIIGCSYLESSQLPLCVSYPMNGFCNQNGRINGAWIFVFASVIFSY